MFSFFLTSLISRLLALAGSGTCNFIEDGGTADASLILGCFVASKVGGS